MVTGRKAGDRHPRHRQRGAPGPRAVRRTIPAMTAIVMDGNALRDETVLALRAQIEAAGSPPVCLATVLVGDDRRASATSAASNARPPRPACSPATSSCPATAQAGGGRGRRRAAGRRPDVHGILVQLPLPAGLDPDAVLDLMPADKDVDGLTERSMGRLVRGEPGLVGVHAARRDAPARALRRGTSGAAGGRHRAFDARRPAPVAAARPQGHRRHRHDRPLPHAPTSSRCAVTPTSSSAPPAQARHDHRRPRQARRRASSTWGCRAPRPASSATSTRRRPAIAGAITPMPGGTGPMTIACLLENTVSAARLQGVDVGSPVT